MRFWDQWLRAWLIRYGGGLFGRLKAFVQAQAVAEAQQELEAGYRQAHRTGALWALLDLVGKRERIPPTEQALEGLAGKHGLYLSVTDSAVLGRLQAQINAARERFPAALTGGDPNDTAVAARVAGFAVRWGAQQGVADAAEGSSALDAQGIETDLLKRWIHLAARHEKRVWHDKLDGVTIGYNEKFRLETPRGVYLIDRPYDPKLPLSEKVGCGHAIQLVPLPGGSVLPWDGGSVKQERIQKGVQFMEGDSSLPVVQTRRVYRALNQAGVTQYLRQNPLKELSIENLAQPTKGFLAGQYDELEKRLALHSSRPPGSFGQPLKPKTLEAFSQTAPDALQALKYSLIHEVGHHLLTDLRTRQGWLERLEQAYAQGNRISIRAGFNYEEYFCECFAAHTFNPSALQALDPVGYAIIEDVKKELELL